MKLRLSSTRQDPARFKEMRVAGQTWGLFYERLSVSVKKLGNTVEFYGAISNNKWHGLSIQMETEQIHLPQVVDRFASEGIIQFFFEDTTDDSGFNIYILNETNRVESYHHCEGSKEKLVRDVSRFYFVPRPVHLRLHLHQFQFAPVLSDYESGRPYSGCAVSPPRALPFVRHAV